MSLTDSSAASLDADAVADLAAADAYLDLAQRLGRTCAQVCKFGCNATAVFNQSSVIAR